MSRLADLVNFYEILGNLERIQGGKRILADCNGRMYWPDRGVYFLFEPGETRSDTGSGPRVVRVGTHGLKVGSSTSLWQRLSQHRGVASNGGGGNHRGSIFRLLVGMAIKARDRLEQPSSWGLGTDPRAAARLLGLIKEQVPIAEQPLEVLVSEYIRRMSVVWLPIADAAGPHSDRGKIERNAIGLLSNYDGGPIDSPSMTWLGLQCDRERVRRSGLWNNNHVDEGYDPEFLMLMDQSPNRRSTRGDK